MSPDENVRDESTAPQDEPPPTQDASASPYAGDEDWSGVGERPLKDHVRDETTVDLEDGALTRVHLGERVENWAGDYLPRPDLEAADPNATPPYNPADAQARAKYLSSGPNAPGEEAFDVHDYVEAERVAEGADVSGYVSPQYDLPS